MREGEGGEESGGSGREEGRKNALGQRRKFFPSFSFSLLHSPYLADRLDHKVVLGAPEPSASVRALMLKEREEKRERKEGDEGAKMSSAGKKKRGRTAVTRTFLQTISSSLAFRHRSLSPYLALEQLGDAGLAPAVRSLVLRCVSRRGSVGGERAPAQRGREGRGQAHQRRGRRRRRDAPRRRRGSRGEGRKEGRRVQGRASRGRDDRKDAAEHVSLVKRERWKVGARGEGCVCRS